MSFQTTRAELTEFVRHGFEKGSIDILKKKYDSIKTMDSDKRATLDQVFRDLLLVLLSNQQADVPIWQQFVTYCIQACRHDLCTPTMPVVLLGDIFDALTLDKCEQLFLFVEDNVAIWKEDLFFSACKNNLLRMCNDLLRRLSRSQNTVFCGRILLFLAKFFPFSERSGLNIVSEFNLDNVTEYGGEGGKDLDILGDKHEPMEEGTKSETNRMKLDYNLYCKFWALQDYFRNPNQCYNKMEWKTFSSHATNVLMAFQSFKLEDLQLKHSKLAAGAEVGGKQHYFAKYLTNQKLLELQLSDSNFRRYVLLQFLILFQYLNSPVKFKSDSCELKTDQLNWVKETTDLVFSLMAETPPDGKHFVNNVKHILQREEQWNAWKNDGCPEFQRPSQQPASNDDGTIDDSSSERRKVTRPRRPKRKLGDMIQEADSHNKVIMGNNELTRLWNINVSNLDACKSKDRDFLPSLESYFEEAMEQADPTAMVDEQYKKINDGNFGWRALRLLARRSPHFFTHSNYPINKLPDYLEMMIKRIMKDRPMSEDSIKIEAVLETEATGVVGETEEIELMKAEEKEESETTSTRPRAFTTEQLDNLAIQLAPHWRKVAHKLGYQKDEVAFFESERNTEEDRARNMLQIWSGDDEDATPDNFAYMLEGLGLIEAAACLKVSSP